MPGIRWKSSNTRTSLQQVTWKKCRRAGMCCGWLRQILLVCPALLVRLKGGSSLNPTECRFAAQTTTEDELTLR